MEKLFNNIDFVINWDVLLGFIPFLGGIIAWLIKATSNPYKEIRLKRLSINKLIDKPNELINDLKIILNGVEIEQLSKMVLILENSGKKTLRNSDFHILPKINLSGFTNIISLNIFCSNKYTTCKTRKIDLTQKEILLEDFESNDYIKIELFFESILNDYIPKFEWKLKEDKEIVIDLKEFDMDQYHGISKDYNAFFGVFGITASITLFLTYLLVWLGLGIDIKNPNNFSIGWKIIFWLPTIFTTIFAILRWNKIITKHHFGFQKVKNWYPIPAKNISVNIEK